MFRSDFVWGVAGSAYQVEGRDSDDGAGRVIWDTFTEKGGISDHSDASVTCDHIHRYSEDYKLMRLLGVKAYRFSVSWARLMPEGAGRVNEKAVALYRDMISKMKENGITPYLTLYHWELPQALQDKGGWLNEEIIEWFGEYARVAAEHFSDLCEYFITLNEPQCFVGFGHLLGIHAPGEKLSVRDTFQIAHNVLRAHGRAVVNLRKYAKRPIKVGYAPTCSVACPAGGEPADIEAARRAFFSLPDPSENWTWNVCWFSDPVFLGRYPEEGLIKYQEYLPEISREDMELIAQPLDFMGQNIYTGYIVRAGAEGEPEFVERPAGFPRTAIGWHVTPECLYWGAKFLYERYKLPLYITENGMSCHDLVSDDGRVHDPNRITYLDSYLSALQQAADDGADVRGYFAWSFLDNFEWNRGYTERFGLVYVDFQTRERIVKDAAYWYRDVMETNGEILSVNKKQKPILFLDPVFKHRIWGGQRLGEDWPYQIPGDSTGECWAVSAHPSGESTVREGIYAGKTLSELWKEEPTLFGHTEYDRFPLLVKILDVKEDVSIQVHPDDAYAGAHENSSYGKTECWYVLDCEADSVLVVGHNARDKAELTAMIKEGRWQEFIRELPIKKGDMIQIDPGTLHAIKGGIMLLEVQQNSDITYRIYDYDRLEDGKPRQLHVEQGIDVITVPAKPLQECVNEVANLPKDQKNLVLDCSCFKIWKIDVINRISFPQEHPFLVMSVIAGDGLINGRLIQKGDHFILPCGYGMIELQGEMEIIAVSV